MKNITNEIYFMNTRIINHNGNIIERFCNLMYIQLNSFKIYFQMIHTGNEEN